MYVSMCVLCIRMFWNVCMYFACICMFIYSYMPVCPRGGFCAHCRHGWHPWKVRDNLPCLADTFGALASLTPRRFDLPPHLWQSDAPLPLQQPMFVLERLSLSLSPSPSLPLSLSLSLSPPAQSAPRSGGKRYTPCLFLTNRPHPCS